MSQAEIKNPLLFCFCGPIGAGKSTICVDLLKVVPRLSLSISTTTRAPRGAEQDGREYYFVDEPTFQKKIKDGEFLEYALFGQNYYGTEKRNWTEAAERGHDVLLDIEVQGARALKRIHPNEAIVTFVFPPSWAALEQRIRARGSDSEARIQQRLELARKEVSELKSPELSDYFLVNDAISESLNVASAIILSERSRLRRVAPERLEQLLEGRK